MKNFQGRFAVLISLLIVAIFSGCASGPEKTRVTVGDHQPPDWVNQGSGAFKDGNDKKVFYGVGLADGIRSLSLQRTTADDRALSSIATQVKSAVKRLSKDYQDITAKSTEVGKGKESTERENVEKAFKLLVNQTLSGAKIIDHWEHPTKNALYSLARIELTDLKKQVDTTHKELTEDDRATIKKRAEKLHDEMLKEGL